MNIRPRVTKAGSALSPIDAGRRHKLRQHAASLATGAVVFLAAIGMMQALGPPAANLPGAGTVPDGRPAPVAVTPLPSSSGSSITADTGAGAEEIPSAAPPEKAVPVLSSPPVAVVPDKTVAAQIMGLPSVYIHVLSERDRVRALKLAPELEQKGIALAGIKVVGDGPRTSDLRYFRPSEKDEALRVQAALLSLGLPAQRLKSIGGFETGAVPRQYELWLVSDYKG